MNKPGQGKTGQDGPAQNKPRGGKSGQDRQKAVERVVTGLAGVAFEGLETVEGGGAALWNLNKTALRTVEKVTEPLRKPLDALGVTELVQRPVEAIAQSVEDRVAYLEEKGRTGLAQTVPATIEAIAGTVDAVVEYLTSHPKVDQLISVQMEKLLPLLTDYPAVAELVRKQVALVLPTLKDDPAIRELIEAQASAYLQTLQTKLDPTLQALIRQQGDAYIDYLNAHPTAVQTLVQGQSMSLANEVMNEVRERTVTADTVAEMIVRRILGRKQRADLPPPPQEVQRRAETARLPSDFFTAAPDPNQPVQQLTAAPQPQLSPSSATEQASSQPPAQSARSNGHA